MDWHITVIRTAPAPRTGAHTLAPSGDKYTGNWTRDHWPRVYATVLAALDPHPAARRDLTRALERLHDELHSPAN